MKLIDSVKPRLSMRRRRSIARWRVTLRRPTARARVLPDVLLIGAQRAGTSSLFTWMSHHPELARSLRKEVSYFTRNYGETDAWYRAHFPLAARRSLAAARGRQLLAFEATPDYLLHPDGARRAAAVVPDARLIVLLRDPVHRAVSHWRHMVALGFEDLSLEEALDREDERIGADLARLEEDPTFDPRSLLRFSYAARGRYVEQLERWWAHYLRERTLVLRSEDLYAEPARAYDQVTGFVGVAPFRPSQFTNVTRPGGRSEAQPDVAPATVERLRLLFVEPNRRLEELLGRPMGWPEP